MSADVSVGADAATSLATRELTLAYGEHPVVEGLTLELPAARVTAIVGPNGCGKSTVVRGLGRLLRPKSGQVLLGGRDIRTMSSRALARRVGLLPQQPVAPDGLTVADLVTRGRFPHLGVFTRPGAADLAIVTEALDATGTADLAERRIDELSGGQRQRVWIAMVLAQQTDVLLLDEPTTFLDVAHQIEVLDLLSRLNAERGTTVVMVLHELNLAARYADHMVVMAGGRAVDQGPPGSVLTEDAVHTAFGLRAMVVPDPVTGSPMVVPRKSTS
ncbi:ABC transporter ATP-binding protein [Haloechinothrix salitolerans]|uniref:ABC transporter ATP-binding protein n=1 Tax=Haloechinothrix salitolerans TaxID=926830 RepID=A0ABW2C4D2_9PSEU